MKVKVNEENCIACGYCVGVCDKVFEFIDSENGTVSHVKVDTVDDADKEAVVEAIESCPTSAIEEVGE